MSGFEGAAGGALLGEAVFRWARETPGRVAVVGGERRLTYAELAAAAARLGAGLAARGVAPGDRVVILADGGVDAVIAIWAVASIDAVVCVVSPLLRAEKLGFVLRDAGARALVVEAAHARLAADAAPDALAATVVFGDVPDAVSARLPGFVGAAALLAADAEAPRRKAGADDLAVLVYTSGSTGEPKGVMLTHHNVEVASRTLCALYEASADDVIGSALPIAFNYGLYQVLLAARAGSCLVLEKSLTYPQRVLATFARERITAFPGVPSTFAILGGLANLGDFDLSSVRYVTNTAAALGPKHLEAIGRAFPRARIFSMFGLTECKRCTVVPPDEVAARIDSVGRALPGVDLWLEGDGGERLGPGAVGELVVRGENVMAGYWNRPEATAAVLSPGRTPRERVLRTGDLFRVDEAGYYTFVGRRDDMLKSRGEKVAPREVEGALLALGGVREAAVIGLEDELWGSALKAFLILDEGVAMTEREVQKRLAARVEPHLVPKQVVFVPDLPRTVTGKVRRADLR